MHLKLRDQQLKTILYIYRLLHQDLMVTINQKSTTDTHKKKKKQPKHNSKDSHQITREENKRGREEKIPEMNTNAYQNLMYKKVMFQQSGKYLMNSVGIIGQVSKRKQSLKFHYKPHTKISSKYIILFKSKISNT